MALFQKRQITNASPLYTVGGGQTKLIIGLGNVGKEFVGSRHNVGFAVVEEFAWANGFPGWILKKDLQAQLSIGQLGADQLILAKPTTLMNLSGQAAQAIQRFYQIPGSDTLVIYDELAIAFGQIRTRQGGADAGHNGVKSLIAHLGADFGRLRIGIGSQLAAKKDASDFVLAKFSKDEQKKLPLIIREASALIGEYVAAGSLTPETRTVI